ncbi:hypothetical protein HAX54_035409 [Datura stramonium]|uniref:NB-ARC domain-containing protein n=1 Tax=Datura stramonium TaxID=4076 RepID=A0ABS8VJ45_DATST|nr:hypothetical protein [Datura stramonium]
MVLPGRGAQEPQDVSSEDNEVIGFDKEVQRVIKRLVEGSDYLEVVPILDDVREIEVVDFVKRPFPKFNKGHRIMMTTFREDVAKVLDIETLTLEPMELSHSFILRKLHERCALKGLSSKKIEYYWDIGILMSAVSRYGINNLKELTCLEHIELLNDHASISQCNRNHVFFLFLWTLKKLTFSNTRFPWGCTNTLGRLQYLEAIKLKENALVRQSWKAKIGGFPRLQVLWIEATDLESLDASNVHFPGLSVMPRKLKG